LTGVRQGGRLYLDASQHYFAFLRGKRVTYFGRQGEEHTEWFPGARGRQSHTITANIAYYRLLPPIEAYYDLFSGKKRLFIFSEKSEGGRDGELTGRQINPLTNQKPADYRPKNKSSETNNLVAC
jgi:hypothetical protein